MHQDIDPRPCMVLPQLTTFQYDILRRMANSKTTKLFAMVTGLKQDRDPDKINQHFNETCRIVELGLSEDITDWPKFAEVVADDRSQGRDTIIIGINRVADRMFKKVTHDKWLH